jgi:hypothetical protein
LDGGGIVRVGVVDACFADEGIVCSVGRARFAIGDAGDRACPRSCEFLCNSRADVAFACICAGQSEAVVACHLLDAFRGRSAWAAEQVPVDTLSWDRNSTSVCRLFARTPQPSVNLTTSDTIRRAQRADVPLGIDGVLDQVVSVLALSAIQVSALD